MPGSPIIGLKSLPPYITLLCFLGGCGDSSLGGPDEGPTEQIVLLSARTGFTQIYVMNTDGSGLTVISDDPTANYDRLEVSRSTGRILFTKFGGATPSGVYWMPHSGLGTTGPLPDAGEYRWSPDGSRLAFTNNTDTELARHVFVINADGSGMARLTEGAETDAAPAWSPDGAKLVFQRNVAGTPEPQLYVINVDGSGLTSLTPGAMPSWSPDGSLIGFLRGSEPERGLWTVGAGGSAPQHISSASCTAKPPAWSPAGNYLLCIGPSFPGLVLPWFVYRVKVDGSETINLTPQGVDISVYSWSQDGIKILYDDRAAENSDVFLMDADGSDAQNLTTDPQGALQPFWTPAP